MGSLNGLELHTFATMQEREKNEDKRKKKKRRQHFLPLPLLDPLPLVANMHLWCFWLFYYYQCYPSYYMRDVLWELFFIQDDFFGAHLIEFSMHREGRRATAIPSMEHGWMI